MKDKSDCYNTFVGVKLSKNDIDFLVSLAQHRDRRATVGVSEALHRLIREARKEREVCPTQ